jgi:transcriptional regulator with XRE-family HTH domain
LSTIKGNFAASRLKEERERLGLSQAELATLAQTTKQSQWCYENGRASPNTKYLERIDAAGADVLYIITGRRIGDVVEKEKLELTDKERRVLMRFRATSTVLKNVILRVLDIEDDSNQITSS